MKHSVTTYIYKEPHSLIHPMFITALLLIQAKGYPEPCNYVGSQSPVEPHQLDLNQLTQVQLLAIDKEVDSLF